MNLDDLNSSDLSRVQDVARFALQVTSPATLLVNMHGPHRHDGRSFTSSVIAGGYTDGDQNHPDARLFPYIITYLENDAAFTRRRARLADAGMMIQFTDWCDRYESSLNIKIQITPKALAGIMQLAKEDAGVVNKQESDEFAARFEVYLKQNWDPDWKLWRERLPIVSWP